MGRYAKNPIIYEHLRKLKISEFRKWGYLENGEKNFGIIKWYNREIQTGSVSISVDFLDDLPFLDLKYFYFETSTEDRVYFTSVKSNIGNGKVWYFVCPLTGTRCRILYMVAGKFYSRKAIKTGFYEKQVYGKGLREFDRNFGEFYSLDTYYEIIHSKYFKRQYKGKLTKKFRKILERINSGESQRNNPPTGYGYI